MLILVTGGSGNGKSAFAESIVVNLKNEKNLPVYYLATMQVYGAEEEKIVARHKKLRLGKGFKTIEQPVDIGKSFEKVEEPEAIALLECLSNLNANEMFKDGQITDENVVIEKINSEIDVISRQFTDLVIVTNNIFDAGISDYDDTTLAYMRALGKTSRHIAKKADQVWEVFSGMPIRLK